VRSFKTLLAAAVIAAIPALAQAEWYTGIDAGANFLQDSKNSGNGLSLKSESDVGWMVQGQVGYGFGPWKVEGELSYRASGVAKVGGTSGSGTTSSLAPMINGIYEFLPQSQWHPFVGLGVGAAYLDNGTIKRSGANAYSGSDWAFAYQGFAGVGYDVTKNVELKAQYRYFATLDYDTKASSNNSKLTSEYADHGLLFGVTYKFGSAPAPAPAPAPVPVAAPAPAPKPAPAPAVAKNFMVFFDFDKAQITPEAARIIQQAAGAAKSTNAIRIDLTGHTDLAGSDKYNQALSLKRANAVRDELVRQGVSNDQILVFARGKSAPLVATPDGVREPQNRRVEIVLP
jgi:outer membrane protein OmpA-like peptidoglycan-associated protein